MENQLIKQSTNKLIISERAKGIAKVIVKVNMLTPFKISADELCEWASEIERLSPETTPEKLSVLIDSFIKTELEFNKNEGIQNIFRNMSRVKTNATGFYFDKSLYYGS